MVTCYNNHQIQTQCPTAIKASRGSNKAIGNVLREIAGLPLDFRHHSVTLYSPVQLQLISNVHGKEYSFLSVCSFTTYIASIRWLYPMIVKFYGRSH